MGGVRWGGLQRRSDQRFDLIITDHARPARPRFIEQTVATELNESVAPLTNRAAIQFQPIGQIDIGTAFNGRARTIRARKAKPAALLRRRVQPSNSARSSSVNTICAACGDGITHSNKSG